MTRLKPYFIPLFLLSISVLNGFQTSAQSYLIEHVTLIPMDREGILPDQSVWIENGIIREFGDAKKIAKKPGASVIDAKGKYLMPGLFDMHAHFFYEQGNNINTCREELGLMLANGLTTVRIQCGDPVYLETREKVRRNEWVGPDLFVSSPQFVGAYPWPGKVFAEICTTPEEAATAVKKSKQLGYDEIKITFMVKRDVYDAIIQTARESGIKVTGHVGPLVKLPAALAAKEQIEHMDEFIDMLLPDTSFNHGQSVSDMNIWRKRAWETVEHLDEAKLPALVKMVKEAGIYVTPTNYFFLSCFGEGMTPDEYRNKPDYAFIPNSILDERWRIRDRYWQDPPSEERRKKYVYLRKKMTLELWKAGVPLMAGSDSPEWFLVQGFSIHDELETFVKAGLTPYAALQTATVNTARYLGVDQRKGRIKKGMEADLLLLQGNPLEDIRQTRNLAGVFKKGKYYDQESLKKMLAAARPTVAGK